MIKNKNEAKPITKHISCDCKCTFNSTTCSSNQEWHNKTCQYEKNCKCKKDYSWNPSTRMCNNNKYLKNIVETSVIECGEIITTMDIASAKMTNTIATNVTSTASINCRSIKVRDCYILLTVLLGIILLLIIIIVCYYYGKQNSII